MPELPLDVALPCVLGAAVDGAARPALLAALLPSPRRPLEDADTWPTTD